MSELFKNIYNRKFFDFLVGGILEIKPDFDRRVWGKVFLQIIFFIIRKFIFFLLNFFLCKMLQYLK